MYFYKKKQMWIFTDEEKDNAHSISTIDYLQRNYGLTFKQDGRGYRCREHNSLFVHADQKAWYWNSRGIGGGDVIEFVIKYENKSYADALVQVINPMQEDTVSYIKAPERTEPQERELLLPPKTQGQFKRVFAYLTKTRCIDSKIVDCLIHKKFIYEDARGNCVFVGYNKTGLPAYAALRSTNTNHRFRRDAVGSDKANGFYLKGFNKQKLYVFESPIDLLSHATLKNLESGNSREWLDSTRLSLAGVSDNALKHFLNEYPEVEEICFCLDNDAAGINATEKYMAKYADWGLKVSSEPPTLKDYNEDLQAVVRNFNITAAAPKR